MQHIDSAVPGTVSALAMTPAEAFTQLVTIVARLRAPDGCLWDREQTPQSAAPYLLEEAFEAAEAIDDPDPGVLCEELGDLLLQVVFQTQMIADTSGAFTIADVARVVSEKLVRRHPHVFGDTQVSGSAEVLANWETIKRAEKPQRTSMLDGIPKGLPALLRAFRLGQKAGRVHFDWPDRQSVVEKVAEELRELEAVPDTAREALDHEFGDLLFALTQYARWRELDPEGALRRAGDRFTRRFQWMEQVLEKEGRHLKDVTADEWDQQWKAAKLATTPQHPSAVAEPPC